MPGISPTSASTPASPEATLQWQSDHAQLSSSTQEPPVGNGPGISGAPLWRSSPGLMVSGRNRSQLGPELLCPNSGPGPRSLCTSEATCLPRGAPCGPVCAAKHKLPQGPTGSHWSFGRPGAKWCPPVQGSTPAQHIPPLSPQDTLPELDPAWRNVTGVRGGGLLAEMWGDFSWRTGTTESPSAECSEEKEERGQVGWHVCKPINLGGSKVQGQGW